VTWAPAVVVVAEVLAGWIVAVGVAVVEVVAAPLEVLPEVLLEVLLEPEVSMSALVPVEWPEYETAATAPKAPMAASPASVVPIVIERRRASDRFRSAGVVRLADFIGQTLDAATFRPGYVVRPGGARRRP
jgi:hypothetical protein